MARIGDRQWVKPSIRRSLHSQHVAATSNISGLQFESQFTTIIAFHEFPLAAGFGLQ